MRNMLLFITALLTSTVLLAQTADEALRLEGYAKNIAQFNRNNPQEKVYLHMDNRSYYIGDTIFFKASGSHQHPSRGNRYPRVLRFQPALSVYGPEQPFGRAYSQAPSLGSRSRRSFT